MEFDESLINKLSFYLFATRTQIRIVGFKYIWQDEEARSFPATTSPSSWVSLVLTDSCPCCLLTSPCCLLTSPCCSLLPECNASLASLWARVWDTYEEYTYQFTNITVGEKMIVEGGKYLVSGGGEEKRIKRRKYLVSGEGEEKEKKKEEISG